IDSGSTKRHCEAKLMRMTDFTENHRFIFASRSIDHQDANEAGFRQHLEDAVSIRTEALQEKNKRLNRLNEDIIAFLGNIVEARDIESGEHVRRVKGFTHIIAEEMMRSYPEYGLTPEKVDLITSASALHDLGKISIPDAVLLKPGRLTPEEFETMKTHSLRGVEILKLAPLDWSAEYLQTSLDICKYHHEKYDGKGYPEGLKGDEIPISAQIVSIVDCFDALINKRVYKDAFPFDEAFEMILRGDCGVFSPKIIDCFKKCKDALKNHAENKDSDYSEPFVMRNEGSDLSGINILMVEDDEVSRSIGSEILRGAGAWVTEAQSGDEALDILKNVDDDAFDAILMDIFMPDMDGFDTTKRIRESKIMGMDTIPIIAVSVSHSYMDVERATESGMNAYLYKPISVSQVSKALMYCMRDQANALQEKLNKSNRVANRDPLTGVRSVAAYMDKIEGLKEKVNRQEAGSFALVECDLNGLKEVNDTYGHDIGDIYLVNCCRAICGVFRHSPVFRVGGDEFVVVLEDKDLEYRDKLMDILKRTIEESYEKGDPIHGKVSVAAGLAVYDPEIDKTVSDVLKRADTSMYNNKRVMHMTALE
ncbi:MAG: diguanylate cyclase, partial [Lachnospiraceae bacterium]|nr:diguanylate cyclase [Lachnospiraceae bacterium]